MLVGRCQQPTSYLELCGKLRDESANIALDTDCRPQQRQPFSPYGGPSAGPEHRPWATIHKPPTAFAVSDPRRSSGGGWKGRSSQGGATHFLRWESRGVSEIVHGCGGLVLAAVDPQVGVMQCRLEQQAVGRRFVMRRLVVAAGEAAAVDADNARCLQSSDLCEQQPQRGTSGLG